MERRDSPQFAIRNLIDASAWLLRLSEPIAGFNDFGGTYLLVVSIDVQFNPSYPR